MTKKFVDQRVADLTPRSSYAPLDPDTYTLTGRTRKTLADLPLGTLQVVMMGQSTNNNSITEDAGVVFKTLVNPTKLFNGSIAHNGSIYNLMEPLLASDITQGHHAADLGDGLVTAGVSGVLVWMIAQGGSYGADWCPGGGLIGSPNHGPQTRLGVLAERIGRAQRCIMAAGTDHLKTIIDWQQGEWDSDAPATTQANHTAALNGMIAECKRTGLLKTGRVMFIHKCTRITNNSTDRNIIRAAQAAVVDGGLVRAGADIDTLDASYRNGGGTHFNRYGAAAQAALKQSLYLSYLNE